MIEPWDGGSGLALGALVAVGSLLGDLSESMIKRDLKIKDFGSLLPVTGLALGVVLRDGFLPILLLVPLIMAALTVLGWLATTDRTGAPVTLGVAVSALAIPVLAFTWTPHAVAVGVASGNADRAEIEEVDEVRERPEPGVRAERVALDVGEGRVPDGRRQEERVEALQGPLGDDAVPQHLVLVPDDVGAADESRAPHDGEHARVGRRRIALEERAEGLVPFRDERTVVQESGAREERRDVDLRDRDAMSSHHVGGRAERGELGRREQRQVVRLRDREPWRARGREARVIRPGP